MTVSFISSLLLSILLISLGKLNLLSPVDALAKQIIKPLSRTRSLLEIKTSELKSISKTHEENQKLKEENSHLKVVVKKLSESVGNQEVVKKAGQHHWQVTPVKLIRLDNLATFTGMELGEVQPGQPVVSGEILVGIVKKVEGPIVVVSPLSSADLKIDAQLENGQPGKYIYRDNHPTITNLTNDTSFSPRTTVFTLPTSQIPENLIIGQVNEIISNPANPIQEATIKFDKIISTAHDFLIITKP